MKEHNKKTLIEALSTLKEYEPPESVWMNIDGGLGAQGKDAAQARLLKSLPQYEPPDQVWEGIVKKLAEKPGAKVVRMRWGQALAVAASLALLLVVYWQLNSPAAIQPDNVTITFSEETVDPLLLDHDWEADEDVFREYLAMCEAREFICEQPEFKQLREELEELTAAKEELKEVTSTFGSDPMLITQIKEIELERTGILKKMMVMLI